MAADKELIRAVELMKEGQEEGFNILYSYTYNYVYARARYFMKNNEDHAIDLTQETYVQAYKGIQTLQDPENIYAWLGAITYRQAMKMYRKTKKEFLVDEEAEDIFEDIESPNKEFQPEVTAEEKAVVDVIKNFLAELPELQRQAIVAFYYDGMKIDDIAKMFECSSNTIKSRLNYAKQFLKDRVLAHEKKYAYRLHSITPAMVYFAFKHLFAEQEYMLAAEKAQLVYNGACNLLGVAPAAIAAGGVTAGTVTTSATAAATVATTTTTTTAGVAATATGVATDVVVKAGLGLGAKIMIGVATVLTTGAVAVGGMAATGNLPFGGDVNSTEDSQSENIQSEQDKLPGENNSQNDSEKEEARVEKYIVSQITNAVSSGQYIVYSVDYEFDEEGRITKQIITENGVAKTQTFQYEKTEKGHCVKTYENEALLSVVFYDENGKPYRQESYYASGILRAEVDVRPDGKTIKSVQYNPEGNLQSRLEYKYDEHGMTIWQLQETLDLTYITEIEYEYDEQGRVVKTTSSTSLNDSPASATTQIMQYKEDNVVLTCWEDGKVIREQRYDDSGNLLYSHVVPSSLIDTYEYDEDGYPIKQRCEQKGELIYEVITEYATREEITAKQ